MPPALEARGLSLAYRGFEAVREVSLTVEAGEFVAIIGPNGGGKSTLLRGLARLLRPSRGEVLLEGEDVRRLGSREVARRLALLPQSPESGLDLTVSELTWRGRFPYQSLLRRATPADAEAVERAMTEADVAHLRDRSLEQLSGGERQRAWIALALAQEPRVLLLDEPTSFLDLRHQVGVMELLRRLNAEQGMTVVAVLHDLLLASRYARRVIAVAGGRIEADGVTDDVLRPEILERVFGLPMRMIDDPVSGRAIPIPALG